MKQNMKCEWYFCLDVCLSPVKLETATGLREKRQKQFRLVFRRCPAINTFSLPTRHTWTYFGCPLHITLTFLVSSTHCFSTWCLVPLNPGSPTPWTSLNFSWRPMSYRLLEMYLKKKCYYTHKVSQISLQLLISSPWSTFKWLELP